MQAHLARLERELGDTPAPDHTPVDILFVTGGLITGGGVILILGGALQRDCSVSYLCIDPDLGVIVAGAITAAVGLVLLGTGVTFHMTSHRPHRQRDALRRWVARRSREAALPLAIRF